MEEVQIYREQQILRELGNNLLDLSSELVAL
jgi:hypothetical protein